MRGRNQALRNVGRLRLAAEKAAQIRALPGSEQNHLATVVARCPSPKGAAICRVYRLPDGVLCIPLGREWATQIQRDPVSGVRAVVPAWVYPEPYWLDPDRSETLTAGCKCCNDSHLVETTRIFEAIRRGEKSFRVR